MPTNTLGDMSRNFLTMRQNLSLRGRLDDLTRELGSGQAADLTRHLGADRSRLAAIDHGLAMTAGFGMAAREAGQTLGFMQQVLARVDQARETLATGLLPLGENSPDDRLTAAAGDARTAFAGMVDALNTRVADRTLFGGARSESAALADPAQMLAALATAVSGAPDATDAMARIGAWFDTPGGGFETTAYLGATGAPVDRQIDDQARIALDARADDPALRSLLAATAIAALATDPALGFGHADRAQMVQTAGQRLLANAQPLVGLQARLGSAEARVEEVQAGQTARATAFGMMRNEMVSADPYDTATALQQVQIQLETHYTLTARLSRLSLAEYLR
jgi:flagellar hook-associated protein 3 FlgL